MSNRASTDGRPDQPDAQVSAGRQDSDGPGTRGDQDVQLDAAIEDIRPALPVKVDDTAWRGAFAKTIEDRIVPELLALTGREPEAPKTSAGDLVARMADAAVSGEPDVVTGYVLEYTDDGATFADALLNVVAPAARKLGEDWTADKRDFMDVTVGLGTLHRVVSAMSSEFITMTLTDRRILLGTTPGELHTFGIALVDHFFRVARWDVDFRPHADRFELVRAVGETWYSVVGLSLSGDTLIEEAALAVNLLKERSKNKQVKILVGGPAFHRQKELADYIAADALALDGPDAVAIADGWVERHELGEMP